MSELESKVKELEEFVIEHSMCYPEILVTSSLHKLGLDRLKTMIVAACVKEKFREIPQEPSAFPLSSASE